MVQRKRSQLAAALVLVGLLSAACSPSSAPTTPAPLAPVLLTPYHTATPSPLPSATRPGTTTPLPSPTATPFKHTVARGEDMGGIAYRYRITLAELIAANPNVNPNAMSVGTVLIIPGSAPSPQTASAPTPSPVPLNVQPVHCSPSLDGGLWCFVLVQNNRKANMENLSAIVRVADPQANQVLTQTALSPLDVLVPDAALPLVAYFPAPVPQPFQASAEMLTAMRQPTGDQRYLEAQLIQPQIDIAPDGLAAHLHGQAALNDSKAQAGQIRIAAVAYDQNGNVVGVRRWDNKNSLAKGQQLTFDFTVYSTAAEIERVDLQVEAQP